MFQRDTELQPAPAFHGHRRGLTLLEIVLAIAIFFGAAAALSQLAWNGSRAAVQARLKTQATIRCEAKLNEMLVGIEAMQSHGSTAFPDNGSWSWSANAVGSNFPGLLQLDVTVSHQGGSRLAGTSVTIRRWARQQAMFAQAVMQQKQEYDAQAKPQ